MVGTVWPNMKARCSPKGTFITRTEAMLCD